MAQTNTSNQQSSEGANAVQRRLGDERVSRRGYDPLADFFTASPFSLMRRMREEMDRNLAGFFSGGQTSGGGSWYPAIEVAQRNGQLQVHAELPGLKPEDVQVEISDDALIIQGERKYRNEDRSGGAYRSERRYGRFYREIPLPEGANAEQAKARFDNGVLEIDLPISEESSRRRTIPVTAGEAANRQMESANAPQSNGSPANAGGQNTPQQPQPEARPH